MICRYPGCEIHLSYRAKHCVCRRHYKVLVRTGEITPQVVLPFEIRFWSKVDKASHPDGCWVWLAGKDKDGYGKFANGPAGQQKHMRAHRVAWELLVGPIPEGVFPCHGCDNPACVRPGDGHLFLGTQKDNIQDMIAKGRKAPTGHITNKQATEIRNAALVGERYSAIAGRYGIAISTVSAIKTGRLHGAVTG